MSRTPHDQRREPHAALNTELTVGQLRWILRVATDESTIAEALQELAEAERREAADLEHAERMRAYHAYVARRQEREREQVQRAYADAKQAAIDAGPISRERVHVVSAEAADLERLRFEVREPLLQFEEWVDGGQPAVHKTRGAEALR